MENDSNKERLSLLKELIELAKADQDIQEMEFEFLLQLTHQMGVSKEDFIQLFEQYISFHPPKYEHERIVQLHRLILLMMVDQQINEKEMTHIRNIGIKMGLQPMAINEVFEAMKKFPNGIVSPERLIEIFKIYHN